MQSRSPESGRLDRIEEKIDKLVDSMVAIARTEEKVLAMEYRFAAQLERVSGIEKRVEASELSNINNSKTLDVIRKLFWIGIVAVSGVFASQIYIK